MKTGFCRQHCASNFQGLFAHFRDCLPLKAPLLLRVAPLLLEGVTLELWGRSLGLGQTSRFLWVQGLARAEPVGSGYRLQWQKGRSAVCQTAWLAKWRSSSTPKARFLGFRQTSNAAFVGWKAWWGCDGERSVQVRCGCGYSHSDVKARHHAELQSLLHLLCCRMFLHQSVFCPFSSLTQLFLESFKLQRKCETNKQSNVPLETLGRGDRSPNRALADKSCELVGKKLPVAG